MRSWRWPAATGCASWPRLVQACRIIDAIWEDDVETVRALVTRHPALLHEDARGVPGNWGPPMSYAANLGRGRIIAMLRERGATDLQFAFDRACLQGQLETARQLHAMGARPAPDALMGPAETQSAEGMAFLFGLGAQMGDGQGNTLAPVAMVLETYGRHPEGKHACLELFARQGVALPDTPTMAVHRGRQDLLEAHLRRDPELLARTFSHHDIYPLALGCHADPTQALHATPLDGTTLLHLCVDNDELELARWMLDRGADPDARAAVDGDGFGGHTALFGCVVSQPYRNGRRGTALAQLLLDRGADPNVRASLRKALRGVDDETPARVPRRHPARLGRRVPRPGLRQPGGDGPGGRARRPALRLPEPSEVPAFRQLARFIEPTDVAKRRRGKLVHLAIQDSDSHRASRGAGPSGRASPCPRTRSRMAGSGRTGAFSPSRKASLSAISGSNLLASRPALLRAEQARSSRAAGGQNVRLASIRSARARLASSTCRPPPPLPSAAGRTNIQDRWPGKDPARPSGCSSGRNRTRVDRRIRSVACASTQGRTCRPDLASPPPGANPGSCPSRSEPPVRRQSAEPRAPADAELFQQHDAPHPRHPDLRHAGPRPIGQSRSTALMPVSRMVGGWRCLRRSPPRPAPARRPPPPAGRCAAKRRRC